MILYFTRSVTSSAGNCPCWDANTAEFMEERGRAEALFYPSQIIITSKDIAFNQRMLSNFVGLS